MNFQRIHTTEARAYWKRAGRWVLCLGISGVLLYLALRGTDLRGAIQALERISLASAVAAVLFLFLAFVVRAWRWHYLLLPLKPIPVMPLFRSTMIGFMANYLLPFRAGELIRAVSIGQTQKISKASALGSVVLERILDGTTLSLTPFLLVAVLDLPPWLIYLNMLLLGIYVAGLALVAFATLGGRAESFLKRVVRLLPSSVAPRIGVTIERFLEGMKGLNRGSVFLPVFSLSVLCWFLHGMYYFLLFAALDLSLSLWAALVLQGVIAVGVILPAGPGYIGNFQYSTILGLSLFGVGREEAFAYSLVAHTFQLVPVTLVGFLFAFRSRLWRRWETEEGKFLTPASHSPNIKA